MLQTLCSTTKILPAFPISNILYFLNNMSNCVILCRQQHPMDHSCKIPRSTNWNSRFAPPRGTGARPRKPNCCTPVLGTCSALCLVYEGCVGVLCLQEGNLPHSVEEDSRNFKHGYTKCSTGKVCVFIIGSLSFH